MHELIANISSGGQNAPTTSPLPILMTSLLISCVACWIVAAGRLRNGLPLVGWERRSAVPWNLIDVLCAIFLQLVAIVGGAAVFAATSGMSFEAMEEGTELSVSQQIVMMMFVELAMVLAVVLSVGHLIFRARAKPKDMGLSTSRLSHDVAIGVVAFLMLTMPVLLLQAGLGILFPDAGQHPFVELLREQANNYTIGLIFVVAVLLAPVIEEFLFRVVIQGWLERFYGDSDGPKQITRHGDGGQFRPFIGL